ncbi:unnamed protein product [Microthlaspi erraticum]|uniref:MADS-box domain-containing protein n=1 Tax=Microthlaspi erraticum TaxID=1685480 RepID=A0A6D2L024_9BRAS|nr:unnamed protein product [Microthlaspi erraticum]
MKYILYVPVTNELETEIKRNEQLKKIREANKKPQNWWEEPIEGLDLAQSNQFKSSLENLKKIITDQAAQLFQATVRHQNAYAGSSSTFPHGVDGGNNINSDPNQFSQGRMVNMNAFFNHNMIPPNHALPFGNNIYGNGFEGFAPSNNPSYGNNSHANGFEGFAPSNNPSYGNNSHGNVLEGSAPSNNPSYRSVYNPNQQPKPEF